MQTNNKITKKLSTDNKNGVFWEVALFLTEKIVLPILQEQAEKRK